MKTKKVYKVVQRVAPNKFASAIVAYKPDLCRYYKIGKTVRPYPGTKLFAFTDLKQAKAYATSMWATDLYVYEARAVNPIHNGWLEFAYSVKEVVKAFAKEDSTSIMIKPGKEHSSCVVCDSLCLTKLVWSPK